MHFCSLIRSAGLYFYEPNEVTWNAVWSYTLREKKHVFSRVENFSQGCSCEHNNSSAFLHIVESYIVIDVLKKLRVVKSSVKQSSTACHWPGRKYTPLERRWLCCIQQCLTSQDTLIFLSRVCLNGIKTDGTTSNFSTRLLFFPPPEAWERRIYFSGLINHRSEAVIFSEGKS